MPYAPVGNDIELYYEDVGHGLPIILAHGGWSDVTEWDSQITSLSERYRVIPYDRRGCGHSRPGDVPQAPDLWVEDQRALMDYLGLEQAVIGGVSLGGLLLIEFMLRYPERVRAAVLVATTGEGFSGRPGYPLTFPNRLRDLGRVAIPTLVVQATGDEVFPPEHGAALAGALPFAELVVLEGGHTINNDNAAEFNRVLLDWLGRVVG